MADPLSRRGTLRARAEARLAHLSAQIAALFPAGCGFEVIITPAAHEYAVTPPAVAAQQGGLAA